MPKMTVRVILKSGVEFSIKCDKFTLTRNGFQQVTGYNIEGIAAELADVIIRVLDYCAYAGIDIENVLEVKHEYNKSRPYRHGGKKC